MSNVQKVSELKKVIKNGLTPLINNNYIFLDLPYYTNVGDILIWQGTLDYLETLPYKCLYSSSIENYKKPEIDKDVIILLIGGGNFSDLWYRHQVFRKKIIGEFPDNKIIILPQSIYFKDEEILKNDAAVFSQHKNLTICLRDQSSLEIANAYFPNSVNVLLPDMAFCMNMKKWQKAIKPTENRILFLNRNDMEKNQNLTYDIVPHEAEWHDWSTMEKTTSGFRWFCRFRGVLHRVDRSFHTNLNNYVSDIAYKKILRTSYIKKGIGFLSQYSYIYTTRLHAAILAVLLNKKFTFFDNSYGKNSGFYDTWLRDVDSIHFIREDK